MTLLSSYASHAVAFAGDDFVLQLTADGREICIIAIHTHQQMALGIRVLLAIAQDIGVDYADLQGAAAVIRVAAQEGLKLGPLLGVPEQRGAEGHGVAGAVGQHVEIAFPVALTRRVPASHHLADRVHVGRWAVDVRPGAGADGVGEEFAPGPAVGAGRHDVAVAHPAVP